MRHRLAFVVLFAAFGSAGAQAPPPDSSASYFAGEWAGTDRQSLHVEKTTPLASIQLRIMPLKESAIRGGFNQSLTVCWNKKAADFHLQRVEKSAPSLERARSASKGMR